MEILSIFIKNFWDFTNIISVYILFGLIFAGILKQIIPNSFIQKHIGENSPKAIVKAALLGIPLPLCSCSVIPFATSLQKSGASKSSLQTFLISTPITGVDSIMATYGAFGWFFTIYRVASSIFISLLAGFLSMLFIKENKKPFSLWNMQTQKENYVITKTLHVKKNFFYRSFDYAFNTLFKDIAKSLLLGILLGSILTTFIPKEITSFFYENFLVSYLFVLAIAAPTYVCAITSIPIGIALILTGFSPGAAFVFLTAGPATNLVTISVIHKILGKSSMFIYLSSVITGTLLFAYIMDMFLVDFIPNISQISTEENKWNTLEIASSVAMFFLFIKYLLPKRKK